MCYYVNAECVYMKTKARKRGHIMKHYTGMFGLFQQHTYTYISLDDCKLF